jgi:hypothetical protein
MVTEANVSPPKSGDGYMLFIRWQITEGEYENRLVFQTMAIRTYNPLSAKLLYDPSKWESLVNTKCWRGGTYGGGGFIIGPDGKPWPLVVPRVPDGHGGYYNASADGSGYVESLDGADKGWSTVGTYVGAGQIFPGPKNSLALKVDGALLQASGVDVPVTGAIDPDEYRHLEVSGTLPLWVGGADAPDYGAYNPDDPNYNKDKISDAGALKWQESEPAENVNNGVVAVSSALQGAAAVEKIDNLDYGRYKVVFQRNVDGRTRAMFTSYQVATKSDGTEVIWPQPIVAGPGGQRQVDPSNRVLRYQPAPRSKFPEAEANTSGQQIIGSQNP